MGKKRCKFVPGVANLHFHDYGTRTAEEQAMLCPRWDIDPKTPGHDVP